MMPQTSLACYENFEGEAASRRTLVEETIRKLSPFIETCKVKLRCVPFVPLRVVSPFNEVLGIDWRERTLLYTPNAAQPGGLIHELGHLVLDRQKDVTDGPITEYRFLGWEHAVAKKCDLLSIWLRSMHNYIVGGEGLPFESAEFGDLSKHMQQLVLDERDVFAKKTGLVVEGEPITCRLRE